MIKNNIFLYFSIALLISVNIYDKAFAQQLGDFDFELQNQVCIDLKNNLRQGSRDVLTNGEVSLLQDFLYKRGHLFSEPTGYLGSLTKEAVSAFQSSVNFSPTGYVGLLTRAKIKEITCGSRNDIYNVDTSTEATKLNFDTATSTTESVGTLRLSLKENEFSSVPNVTKQVARSMCYVNWVQGLQGGCTWNNEKITYASIFGKNDDLKVKFISPTTTKNETIVISRDYVIKIKDSSLRESESPVGKYRLYLTKYSTAGIAERVYEANITNSERKDDIINLNWNFMVNKDKIPAGWYYFLIVNTKTGVWGTVGVYTFLVDPYETPTVNFTVNPNSIIAGGSTTLSWTSSSATYCVLHNPALPSEVHFGPSGSITNNGIYNTTTYSIICTGQGGSVTRSATVTVGNIISAPSQTISVVATTTAPTVTPVTPTPQLNQSPIVTPASVTTQAVAITTAPTVTPVTPTPQLNQPPTVVPTVVITAPAPVCNLGQTLSNGICVKTTVMGPSDAIAFGVYTGIGTINNSEGIANITIPAIASNKTLILTAHEPVNWIISNPNNVIIKDIIAIGYYRQRLTGSVPNVPVELDSFVANGFYFNAYSSTGTDYARLVSWLAGKKITLVTSNFKGSHSAANLVAQFTPLFKQTQTANVINAFSQAPTLVSTPAWTYNWVHNLGFNSAYLEDVTALQIALTREGLYTGEVTGGFYLQTYIAVKALQAKYGIDSTGYVGQVTRAKLNELYGR